MMFLCNEHQAMRDGVHAQFILPDWRPPGNHVEVFELCPEDAEVVMGLMDYARVCKKTVSTLSKSWDDFREDPRIYNMIRFVCIAHNLVSNAVTSSHARYPIQARVVPLADVATSIFAGLDYERNYMRYVIRQVSDMAIECYDMWFKRGKCAEYRINDLGVDFNQVEPLLHPMCSMALCPDYKLMSNLLFALESTQSMLDIMFLD